LVIAISLGTFKVYTSSSSDKPSLSARGREATRWSIYAGVPARRVKARRRELLGLEREYLSQKLQGL